MWLEVKNIKTGYPHKKFAPKRLGPFTVLEVLGRLSYKLKLPRQWTERKIHPVFHASLLTPYQETSEHGESFPTPPPEVIDGFEEHEIEAILNHKVTHACTGAKSYQFLVSWLDTPQEEDEWFHESQLKNARDLVNRYKRKHELT